MTLRILGFGTYDAAAHPRVGILLDGLRSRGHTVRERSLPLGFSTAERVRMLRQPWRVPALAARLASRWVGLGGASRAFRGDAAPDAIVVGYLGHFDVLLARALWPRRRGAPPIVLDHLIFAAGTAADRGTDPGMRTRALGQLDAAALRAADIIVVDTEEHAAQAREVVGRFKDGVAREVVVAPVGADHTWFDAREETSAAPSTDARLLRIVFYGLFTPLQGTTTIARALRALGEGGAPDGSEGPRFEVTLVGGGQDEAEVREILDMPEGTIYAQFGPVSITWREWVDAGDLPGLVAEHDVCLGIFGTTPKALAVVPNKAYQGAAAGCAIVTSDTAPQRRAFHDAALRDAAVLVPPGDADALADALRALAVDRVRVARLRESSAALADAEFSPRAVTRRLEAALREARDARTRRDEGLA